MQADTYIKMFLNYSYCVKHIHIYLDFMIYSCKFMVYF